VRPAPSRTTYRLAAVPLASFVLMGLFWGAWAALVPDIQARTGASPPELGAALLWAGVGALPAMLLTGRLWRRFGRGLVTFTLLLFGLAAALPAVAPDVVFLAAGLACVGAASGALDVAMNSEISEIEEGTGRRLMFLAHALFSLAVLLSSITVGVLRGAGVEPLPVLGTVALAFMLTVVVALVSDRRLPARPTSATTTTSTPGLATSIRRAVILLGVLCAAAFLLEDALMSWSALFLERELGATPAIGGAGPGLFAGAMFIGRAAGQLLVRRFADRQLLVGSGLIAATGIMLAALAPAAEIALVGFFVAGAGVSIAAPTLFGRAGRLAGPGQRGAAVSTLTVFGYLGFVVGPPIVGVIAGATDLQMSFVALAGLALSLALVSRLSISDAAIAPAVDEELPPVARA